MKLGSKESPGGIKRREVELGSHGEPRRDQEEGSGELESWRIIWGSTEARSTGGR